MGLKKCRSAGTYRVRPDRTACTPAQGTGIRTMGLKIGDTLLRVNGDALDSPERVLELLVKLRQAQRLELVLERDSGPLQLRYQIQ